MSLNPSSTTGNCVTLGKPIKCQGEDGCFKFSQFSKSPSLAHCHLNTKARGPMIQISFFDAVREVGKAINIS